MKKVIGVLLVLSLFAGFAIASGSSDKETKETKKVVSVDKDKDADTEATTEESTTEETAEEFKNLEIKEFGYSIKKDYLYYSFCLYNPNETYVITFPSVRITARDANNVVLGTEDVVLFDIFPKHETWDSGLGFKVDEEPATVEFEPLVPDGYKIVDIASSREPDYTPLTVINVAKRKDKIVGEIQNDNDFAISQARVDIVYRDENGNILGGELVATFVSDVPAKGTAPFEVNLTNSFSESYEVYADIWVRS